jgi:hypothetical protein
MSFGNLAGSIELRSSEPPSPSPLRRSSLPRHGDEAGNENEETQSRGSHPKIPAHKANEDQAPSAIILRSPKRKILQRSNPSRLLEPEDPLDISGPRESQVQCSYVANQVY